MKNGGMVTATKGITYLRQTVVGQLLGQCHRQLARTGNGAGTTLGEQIRQLDLVVLRHRLLDIVDGDQLLLQCQQVAQRFAHEIDVDGTAGEVGVGDHPVEGAFQFTDVGSQTFGNEEGHFVRQMDLVLVCLAHQDRDAGLQLRRFDRHGQAPAEAGLEAILDTVDLLRIAIRGQDDLLVTFQQGIEGMEELLLGALLVGEELDVIDEQGIDAAVVTLELFNGVVLQRFHHVLNKPLGVHIDDFGIFFTLLDGIANGVQQVGFTQAGAAIEEQRVVSTTRIVRYLTGSRTRQLVGLTLDEILEGIVHVGVALVVRLGLGFSLAFPALLQVIHRRGTLYRRSGDSNRMGTIAYIKTQGGAVDPAEFVDDAVNPDEILVSYPVQNKAIRCIQGQSIVTQLRLKRPDPHAEFCRGQLILQPVKALLP